MAQKINELIPVMTKEKALSLLLDHVDRNGIPKLDTVVFTDRSNNEISQWTYKGLCEFLLK
jgi:hypothetical protein